MQHLSGVVPPLLPEAAPEGDADGGGGRARVELRVLLRDGAGGRGRPGRGLRRGAADGEPSPRDAGIYSGVYYVSYDIAVRIMFFFASYVLYYVPTIIVRTYVPGTFLFFVFDKHVLFFARYS